MKKNRNPAPQSNTGPEVNTEIKLNEDGQEVYTIVVDPNLSRLPEGIRAKAAMMFRAHTPALFQKPIIALKLNMSANRVDYILEGANLATVKGEILSADEEKPSLKPLQVEDAEL